MYINAVSLSRSFVYIKNVIYQTCKLDLNSLSNPECEQTLSYLKDDVDISNSFTHK